MSLPTDSLIESSSKNLQRRLIASAARSSEERVFGPGIFSSYPGTTTRRVPGLLFSWQLLVSAVVVSLTAFLVFLLGVNIVIQYRTMNPEQSVAMFRKASFIVLSVAAIYAMVKGNVWLQAKLRVRADENPRSHKRLSSVQEDIELVRLR